MHANHVSFLSVHNFFFRFPVKFSLKSSSVSRLCLSLLGLSDGLERIRKKPEKRTREQAIESIFMFSRIPEPRTHSQAVSFISESVILFELLSVAPEETYKAFGLDLSGLLRTQASRLSEETLSVLCRVICN